MKKMTEATEYTVKSAREGSTTSLGVKKRIAKNLAELRKKHKLTQQALAEKLNYSDKAISRWERAETLPDVETLCRVCDLYGVRFEYLLEEEQPDEKHNPFVKNESTRSGLIFTLIAVCTVWIAATVAYACAGMLGIGRAWMLFIFAIPLSCFVVSVANRRIWKSTLFGIFAASLALWSLLLSAYLLLLHIKNLWPIFLIGIPFEALILLIHFARRKKG